MNPRVIGTPRDIVRLVREHGVNRIIVGLADRRGRLPIEELLEAKLQGVRIEEPETMYERLTGKIMLDELKPSWLIFSDGFRARRVTRAVKRGIDVALALVGLALAAPLMILTGLAVRLDSPGPILYAQERVGEHGRVFTLYKFRSMRADAERGTPDVGRATRDDRVTRVGRFIRLTRLDEMPQLWNVLRGDMSFVGPRPERPFFVEQLAEAIPFYRQRHAVKPGVTGWAQVKYRYGASIEDAREKLRYDLYYIKHMSIIFDLTIVFDTIKVILVEEGRPVSTPDETRIWGPADRVLALMARNISTRYLAIAVDARHRTRDDALQRGASGAVGVRPVGADDIDHVLLLGAGPRIRGRPRQVHRAVSGMA